jgi:hypothetical protein
VVQDSAEYWDTRGNSMIVALKLAASRLSGNPPNLGENEKVRLPWLRLAAEMAVRGKRGSATTVLRVANGRIAEETALDDGVTALQQLGLIAPVRLNKAGLIEHLS